MMKFLAILLLAGCRPALFGGGVAVVEAMEKISDILVKIIENSVNEGRC